MNDLDQLRATFEAHAADLADPGLGARPAAVRRRARLIRRRRRGGVALSAAAAVAAVAGLVAVHGSGRDAVGPADTIVGVPVPAHLSSLGFRYDFASGVSGHDGKAVLRLGASDQPRLVSWATSGRDDRLTVSGPVGKPLALDGPDFGDWQLVPPGPGTTTVTATARTGEPGLAVYTLGDPRPPGVTVDGVTFRSTYAGQPLLGAAVGRPGQTSVSAPATATARGVRVVYFCADGPVKAWLHVAIGHDRGSFDEGSGCANGVPVDATSSGGIGTQAVAGRDASARIWVTRGENGPRIVDPHVRVGVGVYATESAPLARRSFVPSEMEDDGHLWQRVSLRWSSAGDRRLAATVPSDEGEVLVVATGGPRGGNLDLSFDNATGTGTDVPRSAAGGAVQQIVAAGTRATVTAHGGRPPVARGLGLAFYVRAD